LKQAASAVRQDLPQEKDTQQDENCREGNAKPRWKIHDTCNSQYAAAPYCGVDMPSWSLTWGITPRHDTLKM